MTRPGIEPRSLGQSTNPLLSGISFNVLQILNSLTLNSNLQLTKRKKVALDKVCCPYMYVLRLHKILFNQETAVQVETNGLVHCHRVSTTDPLSTCMIFNDVQHYRPTQEFQNSLYSLSLLHTVHLLNFFNIFANQINDHFLLEVEMADMTMRLFHGHDYLLAFQRFHNQFCSAFSNV